MPARRGIAHARWTVSLPDFPWDVLDPYAAVAAAHPGGIIDLSIGTPVDSVPGMIQGALGDSADAPGYPRTHGTAALREAAARWLSRRHGVEVPPNTILPLLGTKEFVAGLPGLVGAGPGTSVVFPKLAYPTYEIGARLVRATPVAADDLSGLDAETNVRLLWLNSPSNPTGRVLDGRRLREIVTRARERGVLVASDECYLDLGWDAQPVSVLHPDVCGGTYDGLLAVHSLSKRSNMAGYRAGFATGDPALVAELLEVRKHAGMIVPQPVQAAMTVAYSDDSHAAEQKARYQTRRTHLRAAVESAGLRVEHSEAGLYLWATRDEDCWETVRWLADRGVLAAPGIFYGAAGSRHVRFALTAQDEQISAVDSRLRA